MIAPAAFNLGRWAYVRVIQHPAEVFRGPVVRQSEQL
jgi:hypothetical protein